MRECGIASLLPLNKNMRVDWPNIMLYCSTLLKSDFCPWYDFELDLLLGPLLFKRLNANVSCPCQSQELFHHQGYSFGR